MNFSKMLAAATLALVSALVLVQAGHYDENNNHYGGGAAIRNSAIASHYPAGGCHGYQCNKRANPSPYGPYHSYAVRPVIYGGHGLYNYQGYARHHPAPAAHGARYARSYGAGSRRGPRPSYGGCHGADCGRAPARHYAPARSAHYRQQSAGYALRPVKVVALVPNHSYNNNHGYSNNHGNGNNNGYNNNNGYSNNNGYNNNNRGASYGNGGHNSNHYNAPAQYNQQRHHHGGGY